jgi:hypothetical protein
LVGSKHNGGSGADDSFNTILIYGAVPQAPHVSNSFSAGHASRGRRLAIDGFTILAVSHIRQRQMWRVQQVAAYLHKLGHGFTVPIFVKLTSYSAWHPATG